MGYEISQFDILNRQLQTGKSHSDAVVVSDIGEAKVRRTIFGRAKVKVIRGQDRKRRAWLLTMLLAIVAAAAAWEGWLMFKRVQHEAAPVPLSERIWVSPPVFRPARIAPDQHPSQRDTESLIQAEIRSLLSGPLPRHPPAGMQAIGKAAEKPVAPEPLTKNKLLAAPQERAGTNRRTRHSLRRIRLQPRPAPRQTSQPRLSRFQTRWTAGTRRHHPTVRHRTRRSRRIDRLGPTWS